MRALVTGGSGFVGSFLVDELLKRRWKVSILDTSSPKYGSHRDARFIHGNITDESAVEGAVRDQDYVFHLAGLLGTHELVGRAFDANLVNVGGVIRVLDAVKKFGACLISVSKPNCWLNPYTITKVASEQYIALYRKEFGIHAAVVKWFNVYGGRQPLMEASGYRKAIPTWIVAALNGEPVEVYGDGQQTMDLVHTTDTIEATLSLLENWDRCDGLVFEIGCGEETEVNYIADRVVDITESASPIHHIPMRPGETPQTRIRADISLIRDMTGWKPRISLNEGLQETVEWYRLRYA